MSNHGNESGVINVRMLTLFFASFVWWTWICEWYRRFTWDIGFREVLDQFGNIPAQHICLQSAYQRYFDSKPPLLFPAPLLTRGGLRLFLAQISMTSFKFCYDVTSFSDVTSAPKAHFFLAPSARFWYQIPFDNWPAAGEKILRIWRPIYL